jgi:LysM repeat protein
MLKQIKTQRWLFILLLMAAWLSLPFATFAQSETPNDLVNAVNDLRASHGLEPYRIDPWLMAYAQEHSEYQAAIQAGTHQHSDGTLPQDIGLVENVAGGDAGVVTAAVVVYEIWVDSGHRHTLIGYPTGEIGAGIALSENGQVYYTVDIRPGEEDGTAPSQAGTPAPFVPLETSTPGDGGSIIHTVSSGETLWSIAQSYGVTVDDIRRLNGMAADATLIYVGQNLLIKPAAIVTPDLPNETPSAPAQTLDDTSLLITETMAPTEAVLPSPSITALSSPSDTATPTSIPADLSLNNPILVPAAVITMAIIGMLIVGILSMRKSPDDIKAENRK